MSQLDAIAKAVATIDAHLRSPITVGDVADAVGYSLFHFSRTFNRIVEHTPYDYLMRRRVSESADAVLNSRRLMIDIAYEFQFANPETFTRAFRRMFGITPSDARASPWRLCRSPMPAIARADLAYRSELSAARPSPTVEPARTLVGLQTWTTGGWEGLDALWEMLVRLMTAQSLAARRYLAILWDEPMLEGTSRPAAVCAATRLPGTDRGASTAPLLTVNLPERRAARQPLSPSPATVSPALTYLVHTWLPKAKLWTADRCLVLDYGDRPGGTGTAPLSLTIGVGSEPVAITTAPLGHARRQRG